MKIVLLIGTNNIAATTQARISKNQRSMCIIIIESATRTIELTYAINIWKTVQQGCFAILPRFKPF